MSEIHYFPRYSQRENVVTNNTLLLLLRLHQYNRLKFEKFIDNLCAEQDVQLASSWLQFRQQITTGESVVDGFIAQESIKIAVETKLRPDQLDAAQLENHLELFKAEQNKLLIPLSPSLGELSAQQLTLVRDKATPRNIQVVHASFEDIVTQSRRCLSEYDEEMLALVDDYESFCSENNLLPTDQYTIFTPPCTQSLAENKEFSLYYCPVGWTVRKARYLGIYANRSVQAIGQIAKIVACNMNIDLQTVTVADEAQVPLTQGEKSRILGAGRDAKEHGWDISADHKFFLCDKLEETNFLKKTRQGIRGKRYIDLKRVLGPQPIPTDLGELAQLLRQHVW